jgi:outer membrane protein assembly factor BamB
MTTPIRLLAAATVATALSAWLATAWAKPADAQEANRSVQTLGTGPTDWAMDPTRNRTIHAAGLPAAISRDNLLWEREFGYFQYAKPVIHADRVYTGTEGFKPIRGDDRYPQGADKDKASSMLWCLDLQTGASVWTLRFGRPEEHARHAGYGMCAAPVVEGDRLYVATTQGEVYCLDVAGQANGNDGPFTDERKVIAGGIVDGWIEPVDELLPADGDVIWRYDIVEQLGVLLHDAYASTPLIVGDYIYLPTGHRDGVRPSQGKWAGEAAEQFVPDALPALIVLDKRTGQLVATDNVRVPEVFHGSWGTCSAVEVDGQTLIVWGDPAGYVRAFEAEPYRKASGGVGILREAWICDANPPHRRYDEHGRLRKYPHWSSGRKAPELLTSGPSEVTAAVVVHEGRLYVVVGRDPNYGRDKKTHTIAPGAVTCIDPNGQGDVTNSKILWQRDDVAISLSTPAVADGLVFIADLAGVAHCFDAETGERYWKHDTGRHIEWASPLVADGKVYVPNKNMYVFAASRDKRIVAFNDGAESGLRPAKIAGLSPAATDGVLLLPTYEHLRAFAGPGGKTGK